VAVDDLGRRLGEKTVPATSDGHFEAVEWARQWPQVRFAVEDCRHLTRRLEGDLLRAGHRVARVPTQLMAAARRGGRRPGKSDPIDAEAVAVAALRHPDLPVAHLDGSTRQVKLLCDHRRDLVCERTKLVNRLRWQLHELDPELLGALRRIALGAHQNASPNRTINDGSSTARTMVASSSTAARPTPSCFMSIVLSVANTQKTATITTAAMVTSRPSWRCRRPRRGGAAGPRQASGKSPVTSVRKDSRGEPIQPHYIQVF
jgi:hypothetical protein